MLNQEPATFACQWCEGLFRARRSGSPQRFCSSKCRVGAAPLRRARRVKLGRALRKRARLSQRPFRPAPTTSRENRARPGSATGALSNAKADCGIPLIFSINKSVLIDRSDRAGRLMSLSNHLLIGRHFCSPPLGFKAQLNDRPAAHRHGKVRSGPSACAPPTLVRRSESRRKPVVLADPLRD
jgi:hypothetical protein